VSITVERAASRAQLTLRWHGGGRNALKLASFHQSISTHGE
jgi:hypothetical protein